MKNLLLIIFFFTGTLLVSSQCSVNPGPNAVICNTLTTLQGSRTGTPSDPPAWSVVSIPPGATAPVFSNVNVLTPTVSQLNTPGNYVFRLSQLCGSGTTVTSDVTITAPGAITGFTAGPDITTVPASVGTATLNGAVIPAGYTPSWTFYNIYSYEDNGQILQTNATMANPTTASPTLTLNNKLNHDTDPAYRAVLRITSNNNANCWYEDDAIIRFIPNPQVVFPATFNQCVSNPSASNAFYIDPNSPPRFASTTPNSAGNLLFGTSVSITAVTQPSGGDIQYSRIEDGRIYFTGINTIGSYVFDLKVSNSQGSFTTRHTYNYNGVRPGPINFSDPLHPNQIVLYSAGSTGGSVYCNKVNTTDPISFYYSLDAADAALTSTVAPTKVIPAGGAPSIILGGAGTTNRSATLTPPSGGWRAGTYVFYVEVTSGSCQRNANFYVHISDGARTNVSVNNITVCYPGSGQVSATIPLPTVYQTTSTNLSYLQDLNGRYDFTLVSSPPGSAAPSYQAANLRTLTNTSTVISNLNTPGEYKFKIRVMPSSGSTQSILDAEYACSGALREGEFSIFVSPQVNSNAGSDQTLTCITSTTLNGNNPGTGGSTGLWTLASKPSGAPDPVITNPTQFNSGVTNLVSSGTYKFNWTITTGTCNSTDDVAINVTAASASVSVTPATQTLAYNAAPANLTGSATGATSYQWYSNTVNSNTGGTFISGATATTYTPPTNVAGTRYYYLMAYNGTCGTASATAQVTVTPCAATPNAPTVNTAVSNNCPATTVNLNTQAHTGTIPANTTLQWFTDAAHTAAVPTPNAVGAGTYYAFYYSSSSNCYSPASNPVTVTITTCVCTAPADPQAVNLASITVPAAPSGSVIQWHNSTTPSSSTLLTNTTVQATSTPTNYWVYYYDTTKNCYSPGSKVVTVTNACCNYPTVNLTSLSQNTPPSGTAVVWYTTSSRNTGTQVANPAAVGNGTYWPFFYDAVNTCYSVAGTPVLVAVDNNCSTACYKPGLTTGTALDTKVGISSLGRAGATDADNWPMTRKGGWIALESKTKAFVPNRVEFNASGNPVGIPTTDFVEGMMVYDSTNNCMKIYTLKQGDTAMAWHCMTTQTCPD